MSADTIRISNADKTGVESQGASRVSVLVSGLIIRTGVRSSLVKV